MSQIVILDLDSTLLAAYGKQEGRAFNFHYQSNGYHPLVCYDGITGDLIKSQLRDGAAYSCTGVTDFLQLILVKKLDIQVVGLRPVKHAKMIDLSGEIKGTKRFMEHMRFTGENEIGKIVKNCEKLSAPEFCGFML